MNSVKTPLIFFSIFLLILVGASLFLGNPEGTVTNSAMVGLEEVLKELEINESELNACVDSGDFEERVLRDVRAAEGFGFTGTPASVLLDTQTGNTVIASGAYPFEILKEVVNRMLTEVVNEGDVMYQDDDLGISFAVSKLEGVGMVDDDHIRGNPGARIALIEYSDPDCQFCASFHGVVLRLLNEFENDLVWVYRHFPLSAIHPIALRKTIIAECAASFGGENAFWAIMDTFYVNSLQ
jgi:protein-disulfide isomerase